jgi:hypothetical protein
MATTRKLPTSGTPVQQHSGEYSNAPGLGGFVGDLSDYAGVQLTATRRDMAQAETLLTDAIARLLVCLPRAETDARPVVARGAADTRADNTARPDSAARLAQAMINMQFQDLVSQLLRRADERLARLDKLLQELARILDVHDPSALHAAVQCLGSQTLAPERRTSNSIQQLSMAPGDVELF